VGHLQTAGAGGDLYAGAQLCRHRQWRRALPTTDLLRADTVDIFSRIGFRRRGQRGGQRQLDSQNLLSARDISAGSHCHQAGGTGHRHGDIGTDDALVRRRTQPKHAVGPCDLADDHIGRAHSIAGGCCAQCVFSRRVANGAAGLVIAHVCVAHHVPAGPSKKEVN